MCSFQSGILSVIVEAFIDGLIDDAILVPVSVNYEKLVDGRFVHEQMGTPKKKESFSFAMKSIWKILNSQFGLMRIDFNEPFSLKELVKTFNERQITISRPIPSARKLQTGPSVASTTSMFGIEVVDKHRALVDNIARHVVFDSSCATSVMSTNVVAYLLLNKYRSGVTFFELTQAVNELRLQVGTDRDFGFEGDSEGVIKRAIELLGPDLVQQTVQPNGEVIIEPDLGLPNVIETAYYANTFVPYFALDSVVVTSLATVNEGASMVMNDVVESALLFCDILRYEFIFTKPCQDFAEQVEKSVARLSKLGNLTRTNDGVSLHFKSSETLLSSLAPFTLTYFLVVECLHKLVDESESVTESEFVKLCLAYIRDKFDAGEITYGESISTDSIKNCLKLIEKWAVVDIHSNCGIREISLKPQFNSSNVQTVIERIERFVILK